MSLWEALKEYVRQKRGGVGDVWKPYHQDDALPADGANSGFKQVIVSPAACPPGLEYYNDSDTLRYAWNKGSGGRDYAWHRDRYGCRGDGSYYTKTQTEARAIRSVSAAITINADGSVTEADIITVGATELCTIFEATLNVAYIENQIGHVNLVTTTTGTLVCSAGTHNPTSGCFSSSPDVGENIAYVAAAGDFKAAGSTGVLNLTYRLYEP